MGVCVVVRVAVVEVEGRAGSGGGVGGCFEHGRGFFVMVVVVVMGVGDMTRLVSTKKKQWGVENDVLVGYMLVVMMMTLFLLRL